VVEKKQEIKLETCSPHWGIWKWREALYAIQRSFDFFSLTIGSNKVKYFYIGAYYDQIYILLKNIGTKNYSDSSYGE
jgi:hypothetical protein